MKISMPMSCHENGNNIILDEKALLYKAYFKVECSFTYFSKENPVSTFDVKMTSC